MVDPTQTASTPPVDEPELLGSTLPPPEGFTDGTDGNTIIGNEEAEKAKKVCPRANNDLIHCLMNRPALKSPPNISHMVEKTEEEEEEEKDASSSLPEIGFEIGLLNDPVEQSKKLEQQKEEDESSSDDSSESEKEEDDKDDTNMELDATS